MEERLKIIHNILSVTDENNQDTNINNIKLEFSCNKYSSKKNNIYHITLDGRHLSKRDKYKIKYKCVTCENIHVVGVTQFLRKVNKCSFRCNLCCNKEDNKRLQHSYYLQSKVTNEDCDKNSQETIKKSLIDLHKDSIKLFEGYDDDFKDRYFQYHLTNDDYFRISKNIVSLQNGKYDPNNLEFWSIFKTNNQMLFTSVFYDKNNNTIIKADQPIMKCDNCGSIWRAKLLERYKNHYKILCTDCTLCNKTFKIRTTKNNVNEQILYQSQLELKFIKWCNDNNITLQNGPTIFYDFEGKTRKYKVDFQINDLLIEIKDNHIWHQQQLQSGKWSAKECAVNNELSKNKYKEYYLITPKNWMNSLNKIKSVLH
jgi:hypothetical protein